MVKNTLAIAWKEIQVFLKNRGELAVYFLLPLLLASVIGNAFSSVPGAGTGEDVDPTLILVANQDDGPYGALVVSILRDIDALGVLHLGDDAARADQRVGDGEEVAAVIIPPDFSEKVDAYEPTSVEVIVDPTQESFGGILTGIMNNVVAPIILQGEVRHGIRMVLEDAGALEGATPEVQQAAEEQILGVIMTQMAELEGNPYLTVSRQTLQEVEKEEEAWSAFSYFIPGFTVMFAFFLVGSVGESVLAEKEVGAFRRLLAAPVHRASIIAGKMLAYSLIVIMQVVVLFGVGRIVYNVSLGRSPLALILLTIVLALVSSSLGMLVAAVAKSRRQAGTIGQVLGFVLSAAGGCIIVQTVQFGGFLEALSKATPHGHAMEGYVRLMVEGRGLMDVLPQVGLLALFGVAFFALSMWRFRFD
jgi:ABC-2 type transport system permease protein